MVDGHHIENRLLAIWN